MRSRPNLQFGITCLHGAEAGNRFERAQIPGVSSTVIAYSPRRCPCFGTIANGYAVEDSLRAAVEYSLRTIVIQSLDV